MIIFVIIACWIVSFFFNGIESGLLSIDPVRLRQNVKKGVPAARRLNRLLKHPEVAEYSDILNEHDLDVYTNIELDQKITLLRNDFECVSI